MTRIKLLLCIPSIILAGCQGGGGGTSTSHVSFEEVVSSAPTDLVAMTITGDGFIKTVSGQLAANGESIELDLVAGVWDRENNRFVLEDGTSFSVIPGETEFVRLQRFDSLGSSGFGVIGFPTPTHRTTGSTTYSSAMGTEIVVGIEGSTLIELSGQSSATIDFGSDQVEILLSELSGVQTNSDGSTLAISDAFTLVLLAELGEGGTFEGHEAILTASSIDGLAGLSGAEETAIAGAVFGQDEDEIGGVFSIDDTSIGNVTIDGAFVGD